MACEECCAGKGGSLFCRKPRTQHSLRDSQVGFKDGCGVGFSTLERTSDSSTMLPPARCVTFQQETQARCRPSSAPLVLATMSSKNNRRPQDHLEDACMLQTGAGRSCCSVVIRTHMAYQFKNTEFLNLGNLQMQHSNTVLAQSCSKALHQKESGIPISPRTSVGEAQSHAHPEKRSRQTARRVPFRRIPAAQAPVGRKRSGAPAQMNGHK